MTGFDNSGDSIHAESVPYVAPQFESHALALITLGASRGAGDSGAEGSRGVRVDGNDDGSVWDTDEEESSDYWGDNSGRGF